MYAICRIAKVKNKSAVAGIDRHGKQRDKLTNRTHPEREDENKTFYKPGQGGWSLTESLDNRLQDVDGKIRKNAVLMYEIILAYSPEADDYISPVRDEWIRQNIDWLSSTFGGKDNILQLRYDADETTPHLHAFVCPLKDNKLNAKYYTGGKAALSRIQDSYAESMIDFGLDRGRRYSDDLSIPTKRHKSINNYWSEEKQKEVDAIKDTIFSDLSF